VNCEYPARTRFSDIQQRASTARTYLERSWRNNKAQQLVGPSVVGAENEKMCRAAVHIFLPRLTTPLSQLLTQWATLSAGRALAHTDFAAHAKARRMQLK
jgi:hypothetical protein